MRSPGFNVAPIAREIAKVIEVIKDGPLDRHNIEVKPGMIIESVDGVAVSAGKDIAELLNRKAGKNVLLTYVKLGSGGGEVEISI